MLICVSTSMQLYARYASQIAHQQDYHWSPVPVRSLYGMTDLGADTNVFCSGAVRRM